MFSDIFHVLNTLIKQFYDIFKIICWRSVYVLRTLSSEITSCMREGHTTDTTMNIDMSIVCPLRLTRSFISLHEHHQGQIHRGLAWDLSFLRIPFLRGRSTMD